MSSFVSELCGWDHGEHLFAPFSINQSSLGNTNSKHWRQKSMKMVPNPKEIILLAKSLILRHRLPIVNLTITLATIEKQRNSGLVFFGVSPPFSRTKWPKLTKILLSRIFFQFRIFSLGILVFKSPLMFSNLNCKLIFEWKF